MNRRSFIHGLVSCAVAVRALPLLEKLAGVLPGTLPTEMRSAASAYYSRETLAALKSQFRFSACAKFRPLPKTGGTISFVRYEPKSLKFPE